MLTGKPASLCSPSTPKLFAVRKGALVCRTNPSNLIPLKWASFFASWSLGDVLAATVSSPFKIALGRNSWLTTLSSTADPFAMVAFALQILKSISSTVFTDIRYSSSVICPVYPRYWGIFEFSSVVFFWIGSWIFPLRLAPTILEAARSTPILSREYLHAFSLLVIPFSSGNRFSAENLPDTP